MMANEPITREEMLLKAVATSEVASIEPITREEMFLAKAGGQDVQTPTPITRKEMFLQKIAENGGGSGGTGGGGSVETCTVTIVSEGFFGNGVIPIAITYADNYFDINEYTSDSEIQNVCQNSIIMILNLSSGMSVDSEDGTSHMHSFNKVYIGTSDTTITLTDGAGGNPWG